MRGAYDTLYEVCGRKNAASLENLSCVAMFSFVLCRFLSVRR